MSQPLFLRACSAVVVFCITALGSQATGEVAAGLLLPADVPPRVTELVHSTFASSLGDAFVVEVEPPDSSLPEETFRVQCDAGGSRTSIRGGSLRALLFGLYDLARVAGYGFAHPLYVVIPQKARWCQNLEGAPSRGSAGITGAPRPGAAERGTHLHTQHPIELANVLNGLGTSPDGRADESEDFWLRDLSTWDAYLQWLVANKQNMVEWCLLEWDSLDGFSMSSTRKRRLSTLVSRAKEWGLHVAIDVPVNLQQQHAWRLQVPRSSVSLSERLRWIMDTGVDVVSTEIGSTEFSHTHPNETINLLNNIAEELAATGKSLVVKNHVSTGQFAKGFPDPLDPSRDINFNYITYYADSRIISAPHTVQMYALEDPLTGSYGRRNYTDVAGMIKVLEEAGRPQVFFPETAYWVDFDNSVPLFLPLYADGRLRDLQWLAKHAPNAGHLNFESGWAFGYWINNAAQALAAWHRGTDPATGQAMTSDTLFRLVLASLGKPGEDLAQIVAELATLQNRTLVHDIFVAPDGRGQTLISYLQGWEGMAEVQEALNFAVVQPSRVHPRDMPFHGEWYLSTLAPRLQALRTESHDLAERCRTLRSSLSNETTSSRKLLQDACVGVELFALRVRQVDGIYLAATGAALEDGLEESAAAISAGLALIESLNLPQEWIAWTGQPVPTAYPYNYLWPAASLFFWRRDHQIVGRNVHLPCYLSLYDLVEVGLPDFLFKGALKTATSGLTKLGGWLPWFKRFAGCLSGPREEEPPLDPVDSLSSLVSVLPPQRLHFCWWPLLCF